MGVDQQINVYCVSVDGHLLELTTTNTKTWTNGSMSSAEIVPSSNSILAAVWLAYDGCNGCSRSLLLAYQDSNDKLWTGNITSSGTSWTLSRATPSPGTGLAVNLQWRSRGPPGVRLYYQRNLTELYSIEWEPRDNNTDTGK